jgi:hypothetical protein
VVFFVELVVFDLDGTLLNRESTISDYTSETLRLLAAHDIAYTVATGRTLHSARSILGGHGFLLPQAYKNGVMTWHPERMQFTNGAMLTMRELDCVLHAFAHSGIAPLVFTLDEQNTVYHPPLKSAIERELIRNAGIGDNIVTRPLEELPQGAVITHVNAVGPGKAIESVLQSVYDEPCLVAYSGTIGDDRAWQWLDIHHSDASKGGAVTELKALLGIERVICFGDSDNDLSMFQIADESYAPANANEVIKAAATAVIGHHNEEGIARFLRERFGLTSN